MKKIITFFLSSLFLTACAVDSPISITQSTFKLIQDKSFVLACQSMVSPSSQALDESQLKACTEYYQHDYANMTSFSVENALPLPEEKLKRMGVDQGFEVYYTVNLDPQVRNEKVSVIKVNGKHAVVWER